MGACNFIFSFLLLLQGHYKCLKLLLSKGANWREKDKEGETALHLSTRHRSSKCLSLLKQHLAPGEVDDQDNNKVVILQQTVMVAMLCLLVVNHSPKLTSSTSHS